MLSIRFSNASTNAKLAERRTAIAFATSPTIGYVCCANSRQLDSRPTVWQERLRHRSATAAYISIAAHDYSKRSPPFLLSVFKSHVPDINVGDILNGF